MVRATNAPARRRAHKRVLKQAKGYWGARHRQYRQAKQAVTRAQAMAFVGRRQRKRQFRRLWITRISAACRQRGYRYVGITDHSPALSIAGGLKAEEIIAQVRQIAELNERYETEGGKFRILAGLEADILTSGVVDVPEEAVAALDFVIGAIHQGFSADADKMTTRVIQALESGKIDILAHPTGRLLLQREPYGIHLTNVLEAAGELNVAVEINANPHRLDLDDVHSRFAQDNGTLLSINTDAHDIAHLDFMQYGVYTARRGWVERKSVINTWTFKQLRSWLKKRRE